MFVQIHMLQSMPPGNLNRDETGQPKKAIFGGVTRGRISSQCLKRNIRLSDEFKSAYGGAMADRTKYLPTMIAMELRDDLSLGISEQKEIEALMTAIAGKFQGESEDETDGQDTQEGSTSGQTPQLVFFPKPFARRVAELLSAFRSEDKPSYDYFLTGKTGAEPKTKAEKDAIKATNAQFKQRNADLKSRENAATTKEEKAAIKEEIRILKEEKEAFGKEDKEAKAAEDTLKAGVERLVKQVYDESLQYVPFDTNRTYLTVDIGLFGRMTTSDLVANIEATCQVAHAISTHEVVIEDDFWTAMDDKKKEFAKTQTEALGSAMGSFDERAKTRYDSAVYYKYFNLDLDSLRDEHHLPGFDVAQVAEVFIKAAAYNNPTGKQNAFAAHGMPELILVEWSKTKRPISYANAFLQPVKGGVDHNLMTKSCTALCEYIDSVASKWSPDDTLRLLFIAGNARNDLKQTQSDPATSIDILAKTFADKVRQAI